MFRRQSQEQTRRTQLFGTIAIIISLLSFSLSTFLGYHQFFHIDRSLLVSSPDLSKVRGRFQADLIISNVGNKVASLANVRFWLNTARPESFEDAAAGGLSRVKTEVYDGHSTLVLPNELLIILPGDVKVLRLHSRFDFSKYQNTSFKAVKSNVGIAFTVYTSDARKELRGLMPFQVSFNKDGIANYPIKGPYFRKEHKKILNF